jgi:hypothetical protein
LQYFIGVMSRQNYFIELFKRSTDYLDQEFQELLSFGPVVMNF